VNIQEVPIKSANTTDPGAAAESKNADHAGSDTPAGPKRHSIAARLPAIIARRSWSTYLGRIDSVEDVMARHGGTGPGFDTLRIVLAMVIMGFHGSQILHGRVAADFRHSSFFPLTLSLVPLFFCLSGFLVTGSAVRTRSVKTFLKNRGLRIFPALTVEVVLCALVLGPLLTELQLKSYFSETKFFSYFGNIVGRVRMSLPGVFSNNPIPDTVNASLWTLQPEFYCYLLMTVLMLTTLVFRKNLITMVFVAAALFLSMLNVAFDIGKPTDVFPPNVIVFYFLCGIAAYQWKSEIPLHGMFFVVAVIVAYFTVTTPGLAYFTAIPVTYIMVYMGMLNLPLMRPFSNGDYSYGIYLFNFPIQQSIMKICPGVDSWWALMSISMPATIVFSAMSWHYIEKPALSLKNRRWHKNRGYFIFSGWQRPPRGS
jgi:peptidoglycan/LPS O-acetylase OafA/YrhL